MKILKEEDNRLNKDKNKCRSIRGRLLHILNSHFLHEENWLQEHIRNCPRCRRRFISCGKVYLALSFIKSQPLCLELLKRANTQAVGVLKHSLREAPKAQKLREMKPEQKPIEKFSKYVRPSGNIAASIMVLILMKIGIFTSIEKFHEEGQKAIEQYYTSHLGEDISSEIFRDNGKQIS
ncbi:hypothetical protein ACFLZ8_03365 [Planctomycetota bacterium]